MYHVLLTLHVTGVSIVVGVLFVQSLVVIFRIRMSEPGLMEGARWIQRRIYLFIYYPVLVVTLATGLILAMVQERFSSEGNNWLLWKLLFLALLVAFGFLNWRQINHDNSPKPLAISVHIGIFCVSTVMIYLALSKGF